MANFLFLTPFFLFRRSVSRAFYGVAAVCLLTTSVLHAQFDTATVLGTVTDPSGAHIAGAAVTLKNVATGITAEARADENGDYQFVNTRIGEYEVSAQHPGFATGVVRNVNVTVNARQRVDFTLQVSNDTQQVLVSGEAQLLETDTSGKGQVIGSQQIVNLPLNGRSSANLALLAPGVTESVQSGIGTGGREAAFNVNGLRNTMNNFQLDGIDNNAYGTSNQGFSSQVIQVSPDAIAEFRVETNAYSAEYGRSGGAVINAAYRTGSNQFHGSLWEFHRNTVLNATGFFKPAGNIKPTLIRNQFGATAGGPIVRDRTFFFADYEGYRQVQRSVTFSTIPTLEQRQGILTVPVINPLTGEAYAAGTRLPLTDFARKVLTELPQPTSAGTSNNYQKSVPNRSYYDKFNLRLDDHLSTRLNLFARLGQQKNNAFEAPNIDGPSGGNQNGQINVLAQQLALGATFVQSPSSVWDFRLGISRMEAGKKPPAIGGPSMLSAYGITGLPEDASLSGGLTPQTITGYSQLGRQATNPQFQNPSNVNPRVNYARMLGRHSLKIGAEVIWVNTDVQDTNPLMGLDTYSSQFSRPSGAAANNLFNLADFFFGARTQYELATLTVAQMRQRFYFGYVQDDFRVNSRLTLNMGLRYEFATPYYEANNRMANYDQVTNSLISAKDGSLYDRALVDPDTNDFAPRFGFSLNAFRKTVLRGGYGIGFVHFNRLASAGLLGTNYPIVTRSTITQSTNGPNGRLPLCAGNSFANCFRTTQQGYPTDLPNTVTLYIPRNTPDGYIQNWHISVQHELTSRSVVELSWVGNHALKLPLLADLNQARPPLPGEEVNGTLQARRPIQPFGSISAVLPGAFSNYHALQARLELRASRDLYLLNSFTWSKAIDNAGQVLEEVNGSTGTPQNVYNLAADRGVSGYDIPLLNVTSFVWNVPVGRGRAFASGASSIVDALIGGWQISGINTMRSGRPINLRYATAGPTPVTAGLPTFLGGVALRPNILGDPMAPESDQSIDRYFNTANVVIPSPTQPFGNAGRNIVRSLPFYQTDVGLQKEFRLMREGSSLQFRAEAFNVLNKTNFGAANGDRSSNAFGTIRSTFPARQLQFALKLVL